MIVRLLLLNMIYVISACGSDVSQFRASGMKVNFLIEPVKGCLRFLRPHFVGHTSLEDRLSGARNLAEIRAIMQQASSDYRDTWLSALSGSDQIAKANDETIGRFLDEISKYVS